MTGETRFLRGSASRDAFKLWHKQRCSNRSYGCDIDFVIVTPHGIAGILDYKNSRNRDRITFTEIVAYNDFVRVGIPVFIVEADYYKHEDSFGPFTVMEYLSGDKNSLAVKTVMRLKRGTEQDYQRWEDSIRMEKARSSRIAKNPAAYVFVDGPEQHNFLSNP